MILHTDLNQYSGEKHPFHIQYLQMQHSGPGLIFLLSQIQITDSKTGIRFFSMKLYELFIFQQSNIYAVGGRINNKFLVHITTELV